jgi:hypothetical protein
VTAALADTVWKLGRRSRWEMQVKQAGLDPKNSMIELAVSWRPNDPNSRGICRSMSAAM